MHRFSNDDQGFTLIELLVTILIVGILAAIALPSFLGQRNKGENADARSNARNLMTLVEDCFLTANQGRYNIAACDPASPGSAIAIAISESGLPYGAAAGQVQVVARGPAWYRISARADTRETYKQFTVTKTGGVAYRCRQATSGPNCGAASPRKW